MNATLQSDMASEMASEMMHETGDAIEMSGIAERGAARR